jgi:hypothetical protein
MIPSNKYNLCHAECVCREMGTFYSLLLGEDRLIVILLVKNSDRLGVAKVPLRKGVDSVYRASRPYSRVRSGVGCMSAVESGGRTLRA